MQRLIALLILFLTIGASGSGGTAPDGTTLNCIGKHTVTARATDDRSAYALQTYTRFVTAEPNAAPVITGLPVKQARATYAYSYRVVASDADGDPLSYSLIQAPAGMTVNDSGLIAWTPAAAGEEAVTVRVSDGKAYAEQSWAVSVAAADAQLDVAVDITPGCSYPGDTVTIDVTPVGAIGSVTVDLLHNGTAVTPDSQGRYILTAGEAGIYQADVTATDEQNTANRTAYYRVAAAGTDCDAPYVSLIGLDDNAVVTAPGDVTASVYDDDLGWWRLELLERGAPAGEVMILAEGTEPAAGSPLGTLDPTLLLNGQYELTLQAGDAAGRISSDSRVVSIEGDFKVGHFSITFEDLSVPVAGIPITITRTYDTRQRHKALDFGQGWSLGYQNVRIHENITRLRLEGGASPGHLLRSEPLRGLQQ